MPEAFIVDAVRTPVGRRGGGLAAAHPADLGAHVIAALLARTQADPLAVDDVVFGCVDTVGPQAGDIARTAWLAAGLPEAVPGVTVDRQCGSSQQAVHFAAQAVLSGTADLVVAGGVQNMSMVPIAAAMRAASASPTRSAARRAGAPGTAPRRFPVPGGGPDRGQVGDRPPGDGAVRAGQPPAGGARDRRGRVRRRDRAVRRRHGRRVPAPRHHAGEDGRAHAAAPGRPDHRGAVQPDRGRRGGAADRVRTARCASTGCARGPGSPTCPPAATTRC